LLERRQEKRRGVGYRRVQISGQRHYVHRVVMAAFLARPLNRGEDVHHLGGDRQNNPPANFQLLSHQAHTTASKQRYPLVALCPQCGKPFISVGTQGKRTVHCGRSCGARTGWMKRRARG
jgi:hypothetical protein